MHTTNFSLPLKELLRRGTFAILFVGTLALPLMSQAGDSADQRAIRQTMASTWDKSDARLDTGPIVVLGDRAVAGWTQGARGGRALLERNTHGQWQVTVCGGDGLKDAKTLELTGIIAETARQLAQDVAKAESDVLPRRRALFSTFDGMIRMDGHGAHPPHGDAPAKP